MYKKIKDKFDHSNNCGITMKYSELLEDEYKGINYWQLIGCTECDSQYIVFRLRNGNVYIEKLDTHLELKINNVLKDIDFYINEISNNKISKDFYNIELISNIEDYVEYPIGDHTELFIYKLINKETGEEVIINDTFYNYLNNKKLYF